MSTTPRQYLYTAEDIYGKDALDEGMSRDEIWHAYEAARAKDAEEIAKWKGIVKGVHGALTDIGTVPVPAMDADLYDAVMSIRAKDAELIQRLVDALKGLVFLEFCNEEGLSSGAPTSRDWKRAFDKAQEQIDVAAAAGFTPTEP